MTRTSLTCLLLAMSLAGCSDAEPEADSEALATPTSAASGRSLSPSSAAPAYAETAACRAGATEVLDILTLAVDDEDVRDVAGRLVTIEKLMPDAVARCTAEVARPTTEALDAVSDAVDAAIAGKGQRVGGFLVDAVQRIEQARAAIAAVA